MIVLAEVNQVRSKSSLVPLQASDSSLGLGFNLRRIFEMRVKVDEGNVWLQTRSHTGRSQALVHTPRGTTAIAARVSQASFYKYVGWNHDPLCPS